MTEKKLKLRRQAFALTLCTIVFIAVYYLSMWYASSLDDVPSFTFDFERTIPFIPITIIPYMASGLFFCMVFFSCKDQYQLKILTWRMLFVIFTAGVLFITIPLRFSFIKPDVPNSILNLPFLLLKTVDSPFNQSPSLHIAFAFVFWTVFKELAKWRILLLISLIMVGISTITTYQHHVIDLLAGAILAHVSYIIIPYRKRDLKYQNYATSNYFFLTGWIFITAGLLTHQFIANEGYLLFIPAIAAMMTGYYYQYNSKTLFPFVFTIKENIRQYKRD